MFFFKNHFIKASLVILIILSSCQLKEPNRTHGINFLKNKSDTLILKKTNINDVTKIVGFPHSKSISNPNEWYYFERVLTKGAFHKLGQNIVKKNNVLVLNFDRYGILKSKKLLDLNDNKNVIFSDKATVNEIRQKSPIEKFLNSVRQKMYGSR